MINYTKEEIEEKAMSLYYEVLIARTITDKKDSHLCKSCELKPCCSSYCELFGDFLESNLSEELMRSDKCIELLGVEDSTDEFLKKVGYELILDGDHVLRIKKKD
jgi:hypothetical protein